MSSQNIEKKLLKEGEKMEVLDFMVCSGGLAKFSYILVKDIPENIEKLKEMGCTDDEIKSMRDSDGTLDVCTTLFKKGYTYSPQRGFIKSEEKLRRTSG